MSNPINDKSKLCWTPAIGTLIDLALQEDFAHDDVTTRIVDEKKNSIGTIVCKEPMVCCGIPVIRWLLEHSTEAVTLEILAQEGDLLKQGTKIANLKGPCSEILRVERTVLNFLMRMSGVATLTYTYVQAVKGTKARITDTRKTIPGWRVLDKYAVRTGGGYNHRFDLSSGILIKDNHIEACGSISNAVCEAKKTSPHSLKIEVEVENLEEVKEAISALADIILLDNMTSSQVKEAVDIIGDRALVEVSGGITLKNVREYAEAGVDIISIGALTHSAPASNISLDLKLVSC